MPYYNPGHAHGSTIPQRGPGLRWDTAAVVAAARATDNLDLDAPFICKLAGQPPVMSFIRRGERWTYRMKPGGSFYDAYWSQAFRQNLSTVYGIALASDGSYLWGTRANEVWRTPVPGALQIPPAAGSGAGASTVISQGHILKVSEYVRAHARSDLFIEVDNSGGEYGSLPTAIIGKGSRFTLKYGYVASGVPLYNPGQVYFLEDWSYERAANSCSVIFHCIDAWGLLEAFNMPACAEINHVSHTHNVYQLVDIIIQCIGGSLSYISRSPNMTGLYPRLTIQAGESAAGVLKQLLELVPDVIAFDGLNGCIIYPQITDTPVYRYNFPQSEK